MKELSLHILDALQNSVEAGATSISLLIDENVDADRLTIEIKDNGRGMEKEMVKRVVDPFVTTRRTRRVGLGLPLFADAVRRCGGMLDIRSAKGEGACITATFPRSHIDRAPLGDMPGALLPILLSPQKVELKYAHTYNSRRFEFDSASVRHELGEVPLSDPKISAWLFNYLNEGESSLCSGQPEQPVPPVPTQPT